MAQIESSQPLSLSKSRRKTISVSANELIQISSFLPNQPLPIVIQPAIAHLNLLAWSQNNRSLIASHLEQVGGILFRNFQVNGIAEFEQFLQGFAGDLLTYSYQSTPRTQVQGNVYTSTEYPADQFIPLHNEMSYARTFPLKIAFYCVQPATTGGMTPIADSRRIFQALDPKIRDRFEQKQVMYVRHYGDGLDLNWQTVFQTEDPVAVERYCRQFNLAWEWQGENRLTTRQICPAIATHPITGETVWFNQAHLFHVSSLAPAVQEVLLQTGTLPRNAYYGDGTEIEASILSEIRAVYQQETMQFPWQAGDVLLLDNLLAAHGRTPFGGDRKVLVGMAAPFSIQP